MSDETREFDALPALPNEAKAGLDGACESGWSAATAWEQAVPPELLNSLQDRDRICPVPAGVGWLSANRLTMRLPAGELTLDAPARLLKQVLQLCDGTWTWNEVVEKVGAPARAEFESFLTFLFEQGALIDSVLLTRHMAAYGFQATSIGKNAPARQTHRIGGRFVLASQAGYAADGTARPNLAAPGVPVIAGKVGAHPLDDLLEGRMSIRTFSETPMTEAQLHSLCWAAAGVVKARHERVERSSPRRTTGSGGAMYLVKWMLVLQKAAGRYAPGVYEIGFPDERLVCLTPVSQDVALFHRAFVRPWQQTFAAGAVFAVAPVEVAALRYRNRALQYLFLEAGAGLQNLSLAAPPLGLASSIIGGYAEDVVKTLCRLSNEVVLCSAIFGSQPTPEQQRQAENMMPVEFDWSDLSSEVYPLPFFVARAKVASETGQETTMWGMDKDPWLAYVKAHAESIERQGMREPRHLQVATMRDLPGAVDPQSLARYSAGQYRTPGFPFKRFDASADYQWVQGTDVATGQPAHVIASHVFLWNELQRDAVLPSGQYTQATSSGCGAGPTRDFALLAGFLELVERDAFMRAWLTQTPGVAIPDHLLSADSQVRVSNLRAAGCEVVLQLLPGCIGHAVLLSAVHSRRKFTCVSGAARLDFQQAVSAGLNELEIMVCSRLNEVKLGPLSPRDVGTPTDHSWLHALPTYFRRASPVLQPTRQMETLPADDGPRDLASMLDAMVSKGLKPAFIDITPEKNCIDQGRTPLVVVKAIVPSLVPISFGYGKEPRGMLPGVDRRSFFPHPFP